MFQVARDTATVDQTRTALGSIQSSAQTIDQTIGSMARITVSADQPRTAKALMLSTVSAGSPEIITTDRGLFLRVGRDAYVGY